MSPALIALNASGTAADAISTSTPRAAAAARIWGSATGIVPENVATTPIRRPAARAAANIASSGFRSGIVTSSRALSMAGVKAEQVNRIPSAPERAA